MEEKFLKEFASGLRLVYCKKESRSVGISILTAVGSENETLATNGLSHFIEHMAFKGTKTRSAFDLVNEFESIGAMTNAWTSKQSTCYYSISLDVQAETCAELLSDMMFNSTYSVEELERERNVIIEEIHMGEDDNADLSTDLMSEAFYGEHTLGKTIIGPEKNVANYSRDDLLNYRNKNYSAKTTVISIVGGISSKDAIKLVEKYFEGKFDSFDREWQDSKFTNINPNYIYKFKDIEQCNISIAMPGLSIKDDRKYSGFIFDEILGGGMSSRLFQEVREKNGLAYNVYSAISQYSNNGLNSIYIGTNLDSVEKSIELTKNVINQTIKEGITGAELEKAKNVLLTRLAISQENVVSEMRRLSRMALYGELVDVNEEMDKISRVTLDDVNSMIEDSYNFKKASIGYVGREIKTDLLKLL